MMIVDYAGGEDGNHIIPGDDLLIPTLGGAPKDDDEEDEEDEDNDDNEDEKMFKWVIVFITNLTILVLYILTSESVFDSVISLFHPVINLWRLSL